jgi:hypothetical protein
LSVWTPTRRRHVPQRHGTEDARHRHELIGVVGLRFDAAGIVAIDLVANPEKLAHLTG